MSSSKLADALVELLPAPLQSIWALVGDKLGRPDLAEAAVAALQEDVVRLHQQIGAVVGALSAEAAAKLDAEEVIELALQTHANFHRTTHREKRQRMAHVLLHGIDPEADPLERRLFVRAVAELEADHVEMLQATSGRAWVGPGSEIAADARRTLTADLVARGFVSRTERLVQRGSPSHVHAEGPATYDRPPEITTQHRITKLGARFLEYLGEP